MAKAAARSSTEGKWKEQGNTKSDLISKRAPLHTHTHATILTLAESNGLDRWTCIAPCEKGSSSEEEHAQLREQNQYGMCSVRLMKPRLFLSVILSSAGTDHAVRGWDEWSHRSQRDHPVALHADRIQGTSPRARRDITLHYLLALASLLWVAGYCTRPYILGNIFIQLGPHG